MPTPIPGIDVSHFQKTVNWPAVAKAGMSYCFVKATDGLTFADPRFPANWSGAQSAGVLRGAYHFFRPKDDPVAQAKFFAATLGKLLPGDLPPALDLEAPENWQGIPMASRVGLAVAWLEAVEQHFGIRPIIYTGPAFVPSVLGDASALLKYPLWIAHKTTNPEPTIPKPWTQHTFWQHTDQGQVGGIGGLVDSNLFHGTKQDLAALCVPRGGVEIPSDPATEQLQAALEDVTGAFKALSRLTRALTDAEIARSHSLDTASQLIRQAIAALNETAPA